MNVNVCVYLQVGLKHGVISEIVGALSRSRRSLRGPFLCFIFIYFLFSEIVGALSRSRRALRGPYVASLAPGLVFRFRV